MVNSIVKVLRIGAAAVILCSFSAYSANDQVAQLQRNLLSLQNRVQDLENQLAESEGQIESLNHEIEELRAENSRLKSTANVGLKGQEGTAQEKVAANSLSDSTDEAHSNKLSSDVGDSSGTISKSKLSNQKAVAQNNITPDKKTAVASSDDLIAADESATKQYQAAYKLLTDNKLDSAAKAFNAYVNKYPKNSLTPNAWYWLGQVQYKQKKYAEARVSFLNTAKFKNAPKRADALYKLGVTSSALGDNEKAKRFYEVLIKTYPSSSSAVLARKELSKLN
ncbi:MAG: tol-pal system protein YbgF [Succinivibrio sp.]